MLAGHLGMSVKQAQACIDSQEFAEWVAYHSIEPFSVDKCEYQLAVIASILANVHRKKGAREYKPKDFIPEYGKRRIESAHDIEIKLRALFNGNN